MVVPALNASTTLKAQLFSKNLLLTAVSNRFLEKSCAFNVVEAFSAGTTTIDEINKNLATKALSKYFSSSEIYDSLKNFS